VYKLYRFVRSPWTSRRKVPYVLSTHQSCGVKKTIYNTCTGTIVNYRFDLERRIRLALQRQSAAFVVCCLVGSLVLASSWASAVTETASVFYVV
jgi:hypothetical protein